MWELLLPRPESQVPTCPPTQSRPRQVWPSLPWAATVLLLGCPCSAPPDPPGPQFSPMELGKVSITYGVSMQQALKVIEGPDGVVTQNLVEFLWNGVPLPDRTVGTSEAGLRVPQTWPVPQHLSLPSEQFCRAIQPRAGKQPSGGTQ